MRQNISGTQKKLLGELSETLIPASDTPGAKDVSAHLFALMMIGDCYKKEDKGYHQIFLNKNTGV